MKNIAEKTGYELPAEYEAVIHSTLQSYCATSSKKPNLGDIFIMHGDGYWEYKEKTIDDLL